jgi:hypothetical protein
MTTHTTMIEVNDAELRLIRNALESFGADFGHDEADIVRAVKDLLAKLATVVSPTR